MQLVETIEVGAGGAASIEFTSIPQDADDLLLVVSGRTTDSTGARTYFNSDTNTANYSGIRLGGTGSSVFTSVVTPYFTVNPNTYTSNTFASAAIYIANYTSSAAKSFTSDSVTENNATGSTQLLIAGKWSGTSAITAILIEDNGSKNFLQYSTASLYKVKKA